MNSLAKSEGPQRLECVIARHLHEHGSLHELGRRNAIHLNDTHPALAPDSAARWRARASIGADMSMPVTCAPRAASAPQPASTTRGTPSDRVALSSSFEKCFSIHNRTCNKVQKAFGVHAWYAGSSTGHGTRAKSR